MSDLNMEGMAVAPGVVETIISIAVNDVDGVASVGTSAMGGLRGLFGAKNTSHGIEVAVNDDDTLSVAVRIQVYGGYSLPDIAEQIRQSVAEAVVTQVGLTCATVDVYIDGIQFAN